MKKINLAVFASGSGSNAEQIFLYFKDHPSISVAMLFTNNPKAKVIDRASKHHIPYQVFTRSQFEQPNGLLSSLISREVNAIVLAGFLWLIPQYLISKYPHKIINIHPALLPGYGGKGMFGMNVHRAVIAAGEKESGISIHLVNQHYDEGKIIFQARCPVDSEESPESLAQKIHKLEHFHYPRVIEQWLIS